MDVKTRIDDGVGELGCSIDEVEFIDCADNVALLEPYEGMEFESEDAATAFYDDYATQVGFIMRVMACRRSEVDGRILSRRLGCNKEGRCNSTKGKHGPLRKPRTSGREGCKAMILVKIEKSGKWVVTRFVKDHNHPLGVSTRERRHKMDEKDKRIQELTAELRRKKRLCAAYREQLNTLMKDVEEHNELLSAKVQVIVNKMKDVESED